jgi:tRNA pseudouridine55 synthase
VVAIVRRSLGIRRVGHAGTLDPFATGLLLVLVGSATRLARYLIGLPKEYQGIIRLGITTDTDDATGEVTAASEDWRGLDDAALQEAMTALTGEREQVPPMYSAKHVGGQRAHRLARRGAPVRLAPAPVAVHRFTLAARKERDVWFHAAVGSGTYLRSLARDLGVALGCGAHLLELRRIAVGPYRVADAVPLEQVRQGHAILLPPAAAVVHLPRAPVDAGAAQRLARGQAIEATESGGAGPVALLFEERLMAVAQSRGGRWHPEAVFAP